MKPNPLVSLVQSRKAIIVFVGAVLAILVKAVPALAPFQGDTLTMVEAGLALLAALIAAEDIGKAQGGGAG